VMEFVDGTSLEPLFDSDGAEEEAIVAERLRTAAQTMGVLHGLQPDALGLSGEQAESLADEVDRWCTLLQTVDAALAPGWPSVASALQESTPPARAGTVVHGDFRLGNMLAVG